jgi:hypothetical protein
MKLFGGKEQNFWSLDKSRQVLDYQDFQTVKCQVQGILLI